MAFKDILVHMDSDPRKESCLNVAITLTEQFDAHISGLYITSPIILPVYAEATIPQSVFDQAEAVEQENLADAKSRFQRLTHGLPNVSWLQDGGDCATKLVEYSACYDLVIAGWNDGQDSIEGPLDRLVLESGRPLLIVPTSVEADTFKRVVVAWNSKKEAARALHDAMPLLARAQIVSVVAVKTSAEEDIPCADIARHLARHGINVEIEQTIEDVVDVGHWLQAHLEQLRADLVVMGAYGQSRYREMIFGGVTHHMLRTMPVPCFMAH